MKRHVATLALVACCPGFIPGLSSARTPDVMNYQGVLVDAIGNPVTTPVNLNFAFYDSAGAMLWQDTVNVHPDPSSAFGCAIAIGDPNWPPPEWKDPRKLGVRVAGDPEMVPRTDLASVLFSQSAKGVSGDIETGPGSISLKDKKDDPRKDEIRLDSDTSGSSILVLGSTGDTLFSVLTGSKAALGKSANNPYASNLESSRSNANRIKLNSGPERSSIAFLDTLGDTDNNGVSDVFDVIYLIATAFSGGPDPVNPC